MKREALKAKSEAVMLLLNAKMKFSEQAYIDLLETLGEFCSEELNEVLGGRGPSEAEAAEPPPW